MKKGLKRALATISCLVMCPMLVAQANFTPSVSYKPGPKIVTKPGDNGEEIIGELKDENGHVISIEDIHSIIITPIAEVDTSDKISQSAATELKKVYNDIVTGRTVFARYPDLNEWVKENLGSDKDADALIVRDIFDITEISSTLLQYLPGEGNTIDLTFDLDIPADAKVAPMIYINGKWELAPNVRNNGDGTITVTFEHFSPVAFLVEGVGVPGNEVPVTGDTTMDDMGKWIVLAAISLVAIVCVGIAYRRRKR